MSPMPTKMFVAADTVALRCTAERGLDVLLVERGNEPYKGCWALPGGFVEQDEDLPDAAARELEEETGLRPAALAQVGAWGAPGRDPRGRVVSAVYLAIAKPGLDEVQGGDDAARAAWHAVVDLPPLAFDHSEIIPVALQRLRALCERTHIAFAFLGAIFGPPEVSRVLAALGCADAEEAAERLLAAADVAVDDGPGSGVRYRLTRPDPLTPLDKPVTLFD